jgi:hypothetical protein
LKIDDVMIIRRRSISSVVGFCLAAVAAQGQNDAQLEQYIQLLKPTMWQELNFIRQVCDLTLEQRPKIRAAADVAVKEGAKAIIKRERDGVQPAVGVDALRNNFHEALTKTLTAEQVARFDAEQTKRREARRQAAIWGAVASLDGALFLSEEQREKIVNNLQKNWQREWEGWLEACQYNGQYFPQIPEQHVAPELNPEQKLVWSNVEKIAMNSWDGEEGPDKDKEEAWWNQHGAKSAKAQATAKGKAALLKAAKKE